MAEIIQVQNIDLVKVKRTEYVNVSIHLTELLHAMELEYSSIFKTNITAYKVNLKSPNYIVMQSYISNQNAQTAESSSLHNDFVIYLSYASNYSTTTITFYNPTKLDIGIFKTSSKQKTEQFKNLNTSKNKVKVKGVREH